ncbi:MAG: exonuclease SbcCD subunit D [Chitinophagaceae bacterium]|nr:exonuclease SbcCD subunit D [Chitinophagaceae bacterium]
MRVLHTADWHIGQLFHGYDRTREHQLFLNWLIKTLADEQIDVLLISGDVFDLSNPSAAAVRLFYSFLNRATRQNPQLQVIITAGNHDSPARLESPKPLLESSQIHIIGLIEKDEQGVIRYDKLAIPLKNSSKEIAAWCIAAPYLRMGDYPAVENSTNSYAAGVAEFYKQAYEYVLTIKQPGQAVIALGHLHAQKSELGDQDAMERPIMGGIESIPASAFDEGIGYVALGHIHKAQRVGGKDHIRYSGSPLPMSFSEINYKHQVVVFDLKGEEIADIHAIEIPVSVALLRVPAVHSPLADVLSALTRLPDSQGSIDYAPYVQVCVLLDGPEPGLRYKVESVLEGKEARLAKIDIQYKTAPDKAADGEDLLVPAQLNELKPEDILRKVYTSKYSSAVPDNLISLFRQVIQEVNQSESAL